MFCDSYTSGNSGRYYPKSIDDFSADELCEEIVRRAEICGTSITGDLIDRLEALRNIELLKKSNERS